MVPSRAWLTPLPALGAPVTVTGGQTAAHAPEHADVLFLSAWNRYSAWPLLPTSALPGTPETLASDTVAVLLACPVAAGLLACAVAGAAALDEAGLEAAELELVVLEPLEQAAATKPIPTAPMTLAV
ncbi:MAG TPA: hypothetical protein VF070_45300 [Streptosporangiaceae bacterium]